MTIAASVGSGKPCVGLECKQVSCGGGGTTSVSGAIYDPAGKVPLYNVQVYVPNAPLDPIEDGASCVKCGEVSGQPLVAALTDTQGRFVLKNVPVVDNLPLVIQVGKWRREVTVPSVKECADTALTDKEMTRLPRNKSEGHIPQIALSTGGADALECLLRKIGIDDAEFTPEKDSGRVHLYTGWQGSEKLDSSLGGAFFTEALSNLWADLPSLKRYDVVLLSCEGTPAKGGKPVEARKAMFDYTAEGGRVFASHYHNYWLAAGPDPFPKTATFVDKSDPMSPLVGLVDTSFPKGSALSEWLMNVGASKVPGELEIFDARHTVDAVNPSMSQRWIHGKTEQSIQYFTFNTPIGAPEEQQCGRVVFSDIHVASGDDPGKSFPTGCTTTELSPQEKALLFMLFDLSACIQPDDDTPVPPPL